MKKHTLKLAFFISFFISTLGAADTVSTPSPQPNPVIVYVWDGLRPDAVSPKTTPNLYRLMKKGTQFVDNHSSYPTFTMMNAASFATGDRAGKTGFFGNTLWHPGLEGTDAANNSVDFNQPVFTEDYKILQDLNKEELFFVNSLFRAAHEKQLTTATVGKSGPAFMQDYLAQDFTLDEKHISPLSFAKYLQQKGYPLPKLSPNNFFPGELILSPDNGSPTDADKIVTLSDNVTSDASDRHGSPYNKANEYMTAIYLKEILAKHKPQLSVLWMRNPDSTEHSYGPGSANYFDALKHNDKLLGQLLTTLKENHLENKTNIIIVSDHSHSNVSGPVDLFPLRNIEDHQVGSIHPLGFSVSGDVRSADLLSEAGFHAFDGAGCLFDPVLSGIKKDASPLLTPKIDVDGTICGKPNTPYTTPSYKVPQTLPSDAVIVAANGGSDYFYIPSHNKTLVTQIVKFLASHKQYDAIFIDHSRYGTIDGTIPMRTIGIENPQGRNPDIIVGLSYDEKTKVNGLPGIEFSDTTNLRGMHGSFSSIDVHNFMMASGPDFRTHFKDTLPTGNVDMAPTIAYLLGLSLPQTDGRILFEALSKPHAKNYRVQSIKIEAARPLTGLKIYDAINQPTQETKFKSILHAKILYDGNARYFYFDKACAVRK